MTRRMQTRERLTRKLTKKSKPRLRTLKRSKRQPQQLRLRPPRKLLCRRVLMPQRLPLPRQRQRVVKVMVAPLLKPRKQLMLRPSQPRMKARRPLLMPRQPLMLQRRRRKRPETMARRRHRKPRTRLLRKLQKLTRRLRMMLKRSQRKLLRSPKLPKWKHQHPLPLPLWQQPLLPWHQNPWLPEQSEWAR